MKLLFQLILQFTGLNTTYFIYNFIDIVVVDGEIYIARGDGKGSDGISTYEMVHLRPIPSTDPSQPTSYIVEPVQCSVNGSGATYILHQASPELNAKLAKTSLCNTSVRQTPPVHESNTLQVSFYASLGWYTCFRLECDD